MDAESRLLSLRASPLAPALVDWARDAAGPLHILTQERDADGPLQDRALAIVRSFVAERGLLLFGGLAIDYALRLRGQAIYPDEERPDFDCLSTRSVEDAYDLADRLHAEGFPDVTVVRGIHVQTMRVRTDFLYVADIGHVPPEVFAAIPAFDYRGLRVVGPDFQRVDQHLAFCFPYAGAPREDIFHRWRKDLKRYNLYAVIADPPRPTNPEGVSERIAVSLGVPAADEDPNKLRLALHGFAAYACLRGAYAELEEKLGAPALAVPTLEMLLAADGQEITLALPAGVPPVLDIASPEPEAVIPVGSEGVWFDPYLDVCPETLEVGGSTVGNKEGGSVRGVLRVYATRSRKLAVTAVRVGGQRVLMVSPQYLLAWLLLGSSRHASTQLGAVCREYYGHTLAILRAAESAFLAVAPPEAAAAAMSDSPFGVPIQTLGDVNHNSAYVIRIQSAAQRLGEDPPVGSLPLIGLPTNYRPARGNRPPPFDYEAAPLFRRAGKCRATQI